VEAKIPRVIIKSLRTCGKVQGDEEIGSSYCSLRSRIIGDQIVTDIWVRATATQTGGTTGQIASGGLKWWHPLTERQG